MIDRSLSRSLAFAAVVSVAVAVAGCTPFGVVAGAGATVGAAAMDERGVGGTASDVRIRAEINADWVQKDATAFTSVGLLIHEGRVVLTGTVPTEALHQAATDLAGKVDGVRVVYDHIRVDPEAGVGRLADDTSKVAAMRKAIFLDKSILSLNYNIDASGNVLYLLGVAQDIGEKERVLAHARTISGVRSIVEYIRIKTGS